MFRHSLRILAIGAAATAGVLTIGMGVAQAKPIVHPINPCVISPQACQNNPNNPPVHIDPCVIDPSLCTPPTTTQPPKQNGNGSQGSTGHGSGGSSSAGDPGSAAVTVAGTPAAVHRTSHSDSGSGDSTLILAAAGALAASLAGLAGLAVWRRRAVA